MRWRRRKRWVALMMVFVSYALFWIMGGCADNFILFPSTVKLNADGAVRRVVALGRGELEVWVSRSRPARNGRVEAFVLDFVGNADRAEYHTADVADWGDRAVEAWVVNYPGYGGSTPPAELARIGPAALAAYDALAKEAGDRPIFVTGTSLGTAAALHVAANRRVSGLILRSPPPLRDLVLGQYGWWNLWMLAMPVAAGIPKDLDSLANAKKVKAPAVFILTEADEVVPIAYQQKVVAAYAGARQFVSNGRSLHNDPLTPDAARKMADARAWLWAQASGSNGKGEAPAGGRARP